VQYVNSWYDPVAEAAAAKSRMGRGCVILGQSSHSTAVAAEVQAAWDRGEQVYCVGADMDLLNVAPDAALTSSANV